MFAGIQKRRAAAAAVTELYRIVVLKARDPAFYGVLGVPDTVDGRFDMIVLHAMLLLRRLRGQGVEAEERGQELFDLMFKDMDQSLRELGVGDMSVGKHIKRMAQAFYGRAERYEAGLEQARTIQGIAPLLADALKENVFRAAPEAAPVAAMQAYMLRADAHIAAQDVGEILSGRLDLGIPVAP